MIKNCKTCNSEFEPKHKRHVNCSSKCNSKSYTLRHPNRRKASIKKWTEANIDRVKLKNWRNSLKRKYNITEEQFFIQLKRQNNTCYGCLIKLDQFSARVDHCHKSKVFRGLLCDSCNWALGHAKDSPTTLRRLMAYLDYNIDKTNIYLTGALKNPRIPEIGNKLRSLGFDVMDEWFTPGAEADLNWKDYENKRGRSYEEALRGRAATNIFLFDRVYLEHSDVVITVMPAGKSAMLELGYAKGRNKKTILFFDGQEPDRPDMMSNFADYICKTEEDLIKCLESTTDITETPQKLPFTSEDQPSGGIPSSLGSLLTADEWLQRFGNGYTKIIKPSSVTKYDENLQEKT